MQKGAETEQIMSGEDTWGAQCPEGIGDAEGFSSDG